MSEITTDVTTPEVTEPVSTPAAQVQEPVTPAASEPAQVQDSSTEGEEAPAAPAFKGRDKFKVMVYGTDEQKEHDVPEWLKSTIKDAASEKEVISLLEKAYGLEPVKASRAAVTKERDAIRAEHQKITQTVADVRQTYQRGDIDAFLQKLAIPQERMLQWALDKVNYSQLPTEQQRVLDERTEAQRKAWAAEQQTTTLGQQLQEQTRQAKQVLLQSSLARPDVKSFADSYDARAGKQGAFFEEIRATGELAWLQSQGKIDLTPDQAIEQVMKKWGAFVQPSGQPQVAQTPPSASQASSQGGAGTPQSKPAVIPNLQGRASSPMKSGVRSLDDLKKLGNSMRSS